MGLGVMTHGNYTDHPFSDHPTLEEVQRRYIAYILERTGGKLSGPMGAAEILGMKRSTLHFHVMAPPELLRSSLPQDCPTVIASRATCASKKCSFLYLIILISSSRAGPRYLRGSNSPGFPAKTFWM